MVEPGGGGDFSGIDPQQLWDMISSIKNRTGWDGNGSSARLVASWMSQADRVGLDATRLNTINKHFSWAQDQLPMLRRRHSLAVAEAKEEGDFGQTGMVGAGSGDLGKYKTQEAAQKAGKDAAKKYKDGDITMQQYLQLMQQNEDDPDFAAASCKELGQARLAQMAPYSSQFDSDNPDAGRSVFATFVATSMRGGMQYKDSAGHDDISFLAPLVTEANFPADVLTDLGTQALAPGNASSSDQIWKALAADPKAATQFVHDNIGVLPTFMKSDSNNRGGLLDANAKDFAAVVEAGTIPGPGANANMAADNTTKLVQYYANHQEEHAHPEVEQVFADDIEYYWSDVQASLTDPAPAPLGPGHVDVASADWEGFIHESMQDPKATAELLSYSQEMADQLADSDPDNPWVENASGTLEGTFGFEATTVYQEKKAAGDADAEEWQETVSDQLGKAAETGVEIAFEPGEAGTAVSKAVINDVLETLNKRIVKVDPKDMGSPPSTATWQHAWNEGASQQYAKNHTLGDPQRYADMYTGGKPFLTDDGHLIAHATAAQKQAYNEWLKDPAVGNALDKDFLNRNGSRADALTGVG
ncbi:hypothetical protein SAMN05216223_10969 [Actinacidiphila yanglinensis]|uniref:Uncharacterized protein n=1 Tax=Actinacidiphila yanglinensis TaxID=310779 RepID=A0A1H6CJD8_9ACTN|nr:hypothetical protein [Actinacidiphila yanglinensis]SEG73079.1 hypothetical protein SAMN05216223_10969 [Actinacidiphila yanglinensis]